MNSSPTSTLNHIDGTLNGRPYAYLERLDYDRFEQRLFLKVGNGVETSYTYDPRNRRLSHLAAGSPGAKLMQDIAYSYDAVGNITELNDTAPIPKPNEYGGPSTQHFAYDDLYRLVSADGVYTTAREVQNYTLAMQYDAIHNIVHKNQLHTVTRGSTPRTELATTYDWGYTYQNNNQPQPHAPTHIGNRSFDYDANGNQAGWQNDDNGTRRVIDNRIREVQDPKHGAAFTYDDQGQRKLRKSQYGETAYINQFFSVRNGAIASTHVYAGTSRIVTKVGAGTPVGKVKNNLKGTGNLNPNDPVGGSIVVGDTATPGGMKRVGGTKTASSTTIANSTATTLSPASGRELERGQNNSGFPGQGLEHRSDRANEVAQNTEKNKHLNGGDAGGVQGADNSNAGGNTSNSLTPNGGESKGAGAGNSGSTSGSTGSGLGGGTNAGGSNGGNTPSNGGAGQGNGREFIYFYHPDHLGSTGYVTDEKALRYEHITYFPFGETWVQESTASWRVPYSFTSKEMDPETGLYYFGARYYDPRTSVWQSADPILGTYLAGKLGGGVYAASSLGLYSYTANNPLIHTDPDGKFKLPIHRRIIANALANTSTGLSWKAEADLMYGATSRADIVGAASDYHFDGRANFSEVQATWTSLNASIKDRIGRIGGVNKLLGGYDVTMLGIDLHTVSDFYSHSNYAELYIDYYKGKNNGKMPDSLPLYEDGLKDKGFSDILKKKLRTGEFNLTDNEFYDVNPFGGDHTGPNSHAQMNKDLADTPAGKLAEKAATQHVEKILKELEK